MHMKQGACIIQLKSFMISMLVSLNIKSCRISLVNFVFVVWTINVDNLSIINQYVYMYNLYLENTIMFINK